VITNGINADLVIVVARTDPAAGSRGISLLVVERGMPGFSRGRKLDKIGMHAQDTAELFFDDVRVPADNLPGREGEEDRPLETVLQLPAAEPGPATMVEHVYPSTDELPENQLKFYLHFSAPMSRRATRLPSTTC